MGLGLLCLAALASPAVGSAQTPQGGDSVLAAPRMSYDANPLRAAMMGRGWRELWRVQVKTQVLDLDEYAGGLTVVRRGGGKQTSSLRMRGEDGVLYNFRSIDKDAARGLDPLLQRTFVAWAQRDQISAIFPMAAIVVAPLLGAADLLHPDPTLVSLPDVTHGGELGLGHHDRVTGSVVREGSGHGRCGLGHRCVDRDVSRIGVDQSSETRPAPSPLPRPQGSQAIPLSRQESR